MAQAAQQFMTPGNHYEALLEAIDGDKKKVYDTLAHVRSEACYRNRSLIIYEVEQRQPGVMESAPRKPRILDTIKILDFVADDKSGASCEIRSETLGKELIIGYKPVQLFSYPVFIWMPLHAKLRWSTTPDEVEGGSLAFDLVIRTRSRFHLREYGVVYCETGISYAREFEGLTR